jgi:hypothetical protein
MDNQIIRKEIEKMLEKSTFVLTEFDYDPEIFGNIIAVLYNGYKKYRFVTDRGEIWCNHQLIFLSDYHVAGVDDTPIYLMKAIQQVLDDKKVNFDQCLPVTQYILSKLSDIVDPEKIFLSADTLVYKGKTQHFNSVYLDKENKISFDVYDNDDVCVFYLDYDHLMMKMDGDSAYTQADIAVNTLRDALTCPMKVVKIYQGNKLRKQVLYFLEGFQWVKSGTISYSLVSLFNPFAKKMIEEHVYDFKKWNTTYIHHMRSVKEVIDHWDPIDLLAFAPKDEYHTEIERIELLLSETDDVLILSEGIYKIFTESFDETFQKGRDECYKIAEFLISLKIKG